jgi:MFS-type transporter involved in bile tolerance (Atg22 family)
MLWGVTSSWSLWAVTAVGLWLMFAPTILGISIESPVADTDHLVGALLVVCSVIAIAEVARPVRFLNVPLGLWLLLAPWLTSDATAAIRVSDTIAGVLVLLLSMPLGRLRDHYGTFDRLVVWNPIPRLRLSRAPTHVPGG